jgi:Rad4 beta-hairpin domain 3
MVFRRVRRSQMKRISKSDFARRGETSQFPKLWMCAAALVLLITIAAGGVWHVHSTPEAAATCTACHIGHAPAITGFTVDVVSPEPVVVGSVICAAPIFRAAPVRSSKTSRAPPVTA